MHLLLAAVRLHALASAIEHISRASVFVHWALSKQTVVAAPSRDTAVLRKRRISLPPWKTHIQTIEEAFARSLDPMPT